MHRLNANDQVKGFALIFVGGMLWGLIGPLVKIMWSFGSSIMFTAFLRMFLSALMMLVVILMFKGPSALKVSRRSLILCVALGFVSFALCTAAYNTSILLSGVTTAVVLLSTAPAFGAIASVVIFKERVTLRRGLLYTLCVAGCMLVATGGSMLDMSSLVGVACGLLSGICYSLTPIFARLAGDEGNPYTLNFYSFLFASMATFPFAQPWSSASLLLNPQLLLTALALAALPSVLAYLLYYRGVELVTEINLVPVFGTTEIIVASLLGVLFFGDTLNIVSWMGMAMVIGTIVALGLSEREGAAPAEFVPEPDKRKTQASET